MLVDQETPQGSETPPEVPAEEGATSDANWADMADDSDDESGLTVEGEFEVDEQEASPPDDAEIPPASDPAQAPATEPSVAPVEPVAPVPTPTPQPAAPEPQPAQAPAPALDYNSWKTQHISGLEKHYALDADTAQALLTEPETVLPRLAAQVHFEVTENVLKAVQDMIPGLMRSVTQSTEIETKAQNAFFEKNPDLKSVDQAKILQIGAMFRQVNPNADADTTIVTIGNMVRTALGLPAAGTPGQGAAPAMPSQPVVQPFAPARGGGGGTAPRAPAQANPWASLIEDDD